MDQARIDLFKSRTNGAVFDDNCEQLTELDYPDLYYYDRDKALWAREFMENTFHVLEDGHNYSRGDTISLLDWQNQSCCNIYGVMKRENDLRRYHYEFDLKPKKQGKSPWSSMRSNYHLMADGEGRGLIYAVAADRENARIIHDAAKEMIIIEEELGIDYLSSRLEVIKNEIVHPKSRSKFKVIAADAFRQHGPNLSALFIDEPHSWPNPKGRADNLYNTLTKGIMARKQPLVGMTSTAGFKGEWFYLTKYAYALKLLRGVIRDDRWLVHIWEPDVQALIEKHGEVWDEERGLKPWWAYEEVWISVNPSYGITVTKDYFEAEVNMVRNAPHELDAFLRLHLNVFTGSTVQWMIAKKWSGLKKKTTIEDMVGQKCYAGIYTSKPQDLTSVCLYFPEKRFYWWKIFASRVAYNQRSNTMPDFKGWVKNGYVDVLDGNYLGSDDHVELISKYLDNVKCQRITARSEDPEAAIKLGAKYNVDVNLMSVIATEIKKATMQFQNSVLDKSITHCGNDVINYMISCTEVQMKDETVRPHAENSLDNICGVFAGLLALHGTFDPVKKPQTKIAAAPI